VIARDFLKFGWKSLESLVDLLGTDSPWRLLGESRPAPFFRWRGSWLPNCQSGKRNQERSGADPALFAPIPPW
jgi:hypothetical protein